MFHECFIVCTKPELILLVENIKRHKKKINKSLDQHGHSTCCTVTQVGFGTQILSWCLDLYILKKKKNFGLVFLIFHSSDN